MKQLLDAGADIVYGTNPDIVEPMEVRSKKLKSGKTKYQFGFYSLGCLLSGAKGNVAGVPKNSGLVAKFKYDSDNEGSFFTDVSFSPTYCVSYPSVEDETTAGAHVKVFAMNNVIEYLNDNGSTDSTVKITKPAVNHPYKPDDLRYVPSKTKKKDKTEEVASAGGLARISGFAVIKANAAAKKKEYNDPFYTDNLTKSDFNTIKSAYYDLPRRLFSQSKHKYYEKDGWFYIKK